MKVKNPGPAAYVGPQRQRVEAGEEVDLPAKVAKSLVSQGWEKPTPKQPKNEEKE